MMMYSTGTWYMLPVVIWFVGYNATYTHLMARYMKSKGLTNINDGTKAEGHDADRLLLQCMKSWPVYWWVQIENLKEKNYDNNRN